MPTKPVLTLSAVVALCLLAAGCTHRPYHPTKTDRDWSIDHQACEVSVRTEIRDADAPDTYDAMDEMKMIRACMKAKGWRWKRTDLFSPRQEDAE